MIAAISVKPVITDQCHLRNTAINTRKGAERKSGISQRFKRAAATASKYSGRKVSTVV